MPNRILKESICTSETLAGLSWFEQAVFFRLIVSVDDYGRYFADERILRGKLFPLDKVTDKQIADAVTQLATAGIIDLYTVGGKSYLQLETWAKHQSPPRAKNSKFPDKSQALRTSASICAQMRANVTENEIRDTRYENRDTRSDNSAPELPSGDLGNAISAWLSYKTEKRQAYKATGRAAFIKQCKNAAAQHGETAVIDVIGRSMACNYQGVVWDWLNKPAKASKISEREAFLNGQR